MLRKKRYFLLQGKLLLLLLSFSSLSQAEIVPDNTLPQNSVVNSDCTTSCQIDGGTTRDGNLFHSFEQFSVPANAEAVFNNSPQIENIFTRVTGSSISNIEGTIRAHHSANLFLINPKGIIFSANARLDIGGSFLATTADSIFFEDNSQFSATNPNSFPLLTVSVPIGLQFGEKPGEIINKSQVREDPDPNFPLLSGNSIGIKVDDGKTIALVASGIILDNGFLTALEGRVELGSVGASSFVDLTQNTKGFTLDYDSVNQFEKISITNSQINTNTNFQVNSGASTNSPSGNIQVYGDIIELLNESVISSFNRSKFDGGNILIDAESFTVKDSIINTTTSREGNAGNININADSIDLRDSSRSEKVAGLFSQTESFSGKAGNLNLNTNRLTIQNGARISVTTFGLGEGGKLTINASESIEVIGRSADGEFPSGLLSQSEGGEAIGDAGDLRINTGKLIVQDGGNISVGAIENDTNFLRLGVSEGNGGELVINATESVEVSGFGFNEQGEIAPSTLLSESQGIGDAGNLDITTPNLIVTDRGEVNVSATGTGVAGNLTINTQDITLDEGTLTAETKAGNQGNITITNENNLLLGNNSQITTNAQGTATGGDITINSDIIAAVNNSDITANAEEGTGGNINITAQLVGIEARDEESPNTNDITAFSELGVDGTITIDNPKEDPL
ncbi:MAG: filamentous hemagglutinin N-terminal domain-containing protein, partial [Xenococcaceae cyanobacterium]